MVTNYKNIHIQQTQGSKFGILYMHHKMKRWFSFCICESVFLGPSLVHAIAKS